MYFLYKTKIAFNDEYSPDAVESHLIHHPLPTYSWRDRKTDQKAKSTVGQGLLFPCEALVNSEGMILLHAKWT